jgi:hypothetical protein
MSTAMNAPVPTTLRARALALAAGLGLHVEPGDLPAEIPALLLQRDGVLLYRPGAGEERAILQGVAFTMRSRAGDSTEWQRVQALTDELLVELAAA